MKKTHREMKRLRTQLRVVNLELANMAMWYEKSESLRNVLSRALDKIADLEPELITAPQIIGYAKRVLERA